MIPILDLRQSGSKEGGAAMTTNRADVPNHHRDHEPTLEEIIRVKQPGPYTLADFADLNPFESDEEIDEFIAAVREWRNASLA
jgi:hypothetical protein